MKCIQQLKYLMDVMLLSLPQNAHKIVLIVKIDVSLDTIKLWNRLIKWRKIILDANKSSNPVSPRGGGKAPVR